MMIIPRFPSDPNKKPHLVKLDRVNNNYNKLKLQFSDKIFQFIQTIGVVGQNTSKITRRTAYKTVQLINRRGAAKHPQLITRRAPAKTAQLINDKDIT